MNPLLLSAKMHAVEVHWRLCNTCPVVVGPTPRLVLALRAKRDVELLTLRVDYPEYATADGRAEALLCRVPHVYGLRRLEPEGEPRVWGQEDVDAAPMVAPDALPVDAVAGVQEVRWHGDTVTGQIHNVNASPAVFWAWRGRVSVPRGVSVGIIVRADRPTVARAKLCGV